MPGIIDERTIDNSCSYVELQSTNILNFLINELVAGVGSEERGESVFAEKVYSMPYALWLLNSALSPHTSLLSPEKDCEQLHPGSIFLYLSIPVYSTFSCISFELSLPLRL